MHDQALKEYGGTHGLKNENLLLSALARAENSRHNAETPRPDTANSGGYLLASASPFNRIRPKEPYTVEMDQM
jgi:death-on-curing protein